MASVAYVPTGIAMVRTGRDDKIFISQPPTHTKVQKLAAASYRLYSNQQKPCQNYCLLFFNQLVLAGLQTRSEL
jgi:hypothetical protein